MGFYEEVARFLRRQTVRRRPFVAGGGPTTAETRTKGPGDPPPSGPGAGPGFGTPIKWTDPDPPGGPKVGTGVPTQWVVKKPKPGVQSPTKWVPPGGGPKVGSGGVIKWVPPGGGPKVGPGGPWLPNSGDPPGPGGGPIVGSGFPNQWVVKGKAKGSAQQPGPWTPQIGPPAAGVIVLPPNQWHVTDGATQAGLYDQLVPRRRAFWDRTESWPATAISSSTWLVQLGTWSIASPIISNTVFDAGTLKGLLIYAAQQSYYDVRIAAILRNPVLASAHAVAARMTFSGGQWSGYYGVAANTTYTLFRLDAGVATVLATSAGTAVANGDTLTLTIKGTAITLAATGLGAALNATDGTYTYGAVGLTNANNRQADYDTTTITDRPS